MPSDWATATLLVAIPAKAAARASARRLRGTPFMRVPALPRPPLQRWSRWLIFPVLLFLNYLLITVVLPKAPERVEVSYTFFKQQVQADNVVEISTRTDTIQGTFKQAVAYQPNADTPPRMAADFSTVIP